MRGRDLKTVRFTEAIPAFNIQAGDRIVFGDEWASLVRDIPIGVARAFVVAEEVRAPSPSASRNLSVVRGGA